MAVKANGASFSGCGAGMVALNGSTITADNANLSGCGIGVISDDTSDVNINNANISNCGIGIFDGDISEFIEKLKANEIDLLQFIKMLEEIKDISTSNDKKQVIKKYGFFEILNKLQALQFLYEQGSKLLQLMSQTNLF